MFEEIGLGIIGAGRWGNRSSNQFARQEIEICLRF